MKEGLGHLDNSENDPQTEEYHPLYTIHTYELCSANFEAGEIHLYYGATQALDEANVSWQEVLTRHLQGEHGRINEQQELLNELAIAGFDRAVFSKYEFDNCHVFVHTDLIHRLTIIS